MPALTLLIENLDRLPDGGPVRFTITGPRGFDIGRDPYLDWTLPDPTRVVSGRHCEVRFRDGAYWLHDVSTNGTFVNGGDHRLAVPHRLRQGDRIEIGHYIIRAEVDVSDIPTQAPVSPAAPAAGDLWDASSAAPAISPDDLRPRPDLRRHSDMLDWFADIAAPIPEAAPPAPPQPALAWGGEPHQPFGAAPLPVQRAAEPADAGPRPDAETQPFTAPVPPGLPPATWPPVAPPAPAAPGGLPRVADAPSVVPAARGVAPPPVDAPRPMPAAAAGPAGAPFDLAEHLARGAGVPADVFAQRTPEELALLTGRLLRLSCENLKQMLAARMETKGLVRSTNQTTIQAFENNPLKFSPTVEDAMRILFGPPTRSYLDAERALEDSYRDLKTHQINTYAAMQQALKIVVEDLDPEALDAATEREGGLGGMIGSRKAKLWDLYVTRWRAKTARHDNGLVDAFMLYFAECYDRLSNKLRS